MEEEKEEGGSGKREGGGSGVMSFKGRKRESLSRGGGCVGELGRRIVGERRERREGERSVGM